MVTPEKRREYVNKWLEKNPDYYTKYYLEHRDQITARRKAWRARNPDKVKAQSKRDAARNKNAKRHKSDKHRAPQAVCRAVKTGKLTRPKTCSKCGMEGKVEGHHPDHTKFLEVVWLCRCCHMEEHRVYVGLPNSL